MFADWIDEREAAEERRKKELESHIAAFREFLANVIRHKESEHSAEFQPADCLNMIFEGAVALTERFEQAGDDLYQRLDKLQKESDDMDLWWKKRTVWISWEGEYEDRRLLGIYKDAKSAFTDVPLNKRRHKSSLPSKVLLWDACWLKDKRHLSSR
jgi:hypothetical protein